MGSRLLKIPTIQGDGVIVVQGCLKELNLVLGNKLKGFRNKEEGHWTFWTAKKTSERCSDKRILHIHVAAAVPCLFYNSDNR